MLEFKFQYLPRKGVFWPVAVTSRWWSLEQFFSNLHLKRYFLIFWKVLHLSFSILQSYNSFGERSHVWRGGACFNQGGLCTQLDLAIIIHMIMIHWTWNWLTIVSHWTWKSSSISLQAKGQLSLCSFESYDLSYACKACLYPTECAPEPNPPSK